MRAFLLAATLSGCTVPQARTAHSVSEVTLAASLSAMLATILVAYALPDYQDDILEGGMAFIPIALGSALVYVAVDGVVQNAEPKPDPHDDARTTAWNLAREAKRAARVGDCAQVQAIQPRVRDLDSAIYLRFLRDKIIQACLAPPPAP